MGAPDLKVVRGGDNAVCGALTKAGDPCQNPAGDDGRCWLPAHRDFPRNSEEDLPDPPDHLGEIGRSYWRYHMSRCARAGILDAVDLTVIEKAAEVAQIMRKCWDNVDKRGPDVPDRRGGIKTNPALSKYNSLMPDYRQLTKQIDGWVAQGEASKDETPSGDPWSDW